MMEKLEVVCNSIQEKNPSLIKHICREIQKERPWGDPLDQVELARAKKSAGGARSQKSGRSRGSVRTRTSKKSGFSIRD